MFRRGCAGCHGALDGGRPPIIQENVSHGICGLCGPELYGSLWRGKTPPGRWPGSRLARAVALAGDSPAVVADGLGVSPERVEAALTSEWLPADLQRRLVDSGWATYYHDYLLLEVWGEAA